MSTPRMALVTGGARGIGAAICRALAARGDHVIVAARRLGSCQELAGELVEQGHRASAMALDVTDRESVAAAFTSLRREHGAVLHLVNNAGVAKSAPLFGEGDSDLLQLHMDVNFHGPRRVLEIALADMLSAGYGRVVQVASSAALRGYAYVASYAASKHALLGFSRSAALELARKGVALNVVCPHYVDSPMTARSVERVMQKTGKSEAEARAFFAAENPGGVLVTEQEVAAEVTDLIHGPHTGRVTELIGGACRIVDEGFAMTVGCERDS